jgi:hypothetical protein
MTIAIIYRELVSFTNIHGGVPEAHVKHLLSLKEAAVQLHLQIATLRDWRQRRAHIAFVKVVGESVLPKKVSTRLTPFCPCRAETDTGIHPVDAEKRSSKSSGVPSPTWKRKKARCELRGDPRR